MSNFLNSALAVNTHLEQVRQLRGQIMEKWESVGFLDGLEGHIKENMAQLYENQAVQLIREGTGAEGSSGSFETVVFPIVRRVFSKLLANDIVSVQAMNLPIGKLFYFVPKTSGRLDPTSAVPGGEFGDPHLDDPRFSAHTGLYGNDKIQLPVCVGGCDQPTQYLAKNLYDIFYNDGLFDHSKGKVTMKLTNAVPGKLDSSGNFVTTDNAFVVATDNTIREIVVKVTGFTGGAGESKGRLTGPDGHNMDTESFLASLKIVNAGPALSDPNGNVVIANAANVPFRVVTQKYGKGIVKYDDICDGLGHIYLGLDLSHPVPHNGQSTYDGYVGVSGTTTGATAGITATTGTFQAAWAEYATLEFATEMGEVTFQLDEVVVSAEERKLRATWSPELAQDVSAFHNIDAEAELTALLSEQMASEVDREILRDLRKAAPWQLRFDYNGWRKASLAANAYTQKDWNQVLITKVNQISAQIHKSTLRGGANFIVVSSEISAILDDLEYFHVSDANPEQDQYNMGIERIGSLGGRYQVYRDPYAPAASMIIGHKGKSLLDTGYIYAPYVPMQLTPTLTNPFNFTPVKGIAMRSAKKVVNNRYFGHITVDGVPTFNIAELR